MPQDTDCVETIKSSEDNFAIKKKELEKFQSEFMKLRRNMTSGEGAARVDVKEITEFIQEREGAYQDYQDASALNTATFKLLPEHGISPKIQPEIFL